MKLIGKLGILVLLASLGVNCNKGNSNTFFTTSTNTVLSTPNPNTFRTPYPIHREILTTVFWTGEKPSIQDGRTGNKMSAFDECWMKHFGGEDFPYNRRIENGISFPADFNPKENPFYFALPFNDTRGNITEDEKRRIYWFNESPIPPNSGSHLKNRWIKIWLSKNPNRVVYAQWQDVGPYCEDDVEYVFGKADNYKNKELAKRMREKGKSVFQDENFIKLSENCNPNNLKEAFDENGKTTNLGAGLDVSPAVRDYLQEQVSSPNGSFTSNWQFVDEKDVPEGLWKKVVTKSGTCWNDCCKK